jgi:hypothetical protein
VADPLQVAAEHQARQEALARAAAAAVRRAWREVEAPDLTASWSRVLARVLAALVAAQRAAAGDADDYVTRALAAQGLHLASAGGVAADQLAGVASDGRNLASLLTRPVVVAKEAIGAGSTVTSALAAGESALDMIAQTQVADAGRAAEQVAIAARPRVGFVRMVSAPCCSRCAILAGRWYRYNAGFARHPRCHCRAIPAAEDAAGALTTSPTELFGRGQITDLSAADRRAVELGSDLSRVVNAHRGMYVAGGRKFTTEAAAGVRLMPEQILAGAASREDAVRLLRKFGYIL